MNLAEMDAFRKHREGKSAEHAREVADRVAEARRRFSDTETAVHRFMESEYAKLGEGADEDQKDRTVAAAAAKKFGITEVEAARIYVAVDGAGIVDE